MARGDPTATTALFDQPEALARPGGEGGQQRSPAAFPAFREMRPQRVEDHAAGRAP